jgi:hypothetical protein
MLRALAILLSVAAAVCMALAIVGMLTGRPGPRAGSFLRAAAVACFGGAVALAATSR